jgi:hypothetical protein
VIRFVILFALTWVLFVSVANALPKQGASVIEPVQNLGLLSALKKPEIKQALSDVKTSGDQVLIESANAKGTSARLPSNVSLIK